LAGALVRKYHSVHEADVGPALETMAEAQETPPRTSEGAVPENLADRHGGASINCTSSAERQVLAQLLLEWPVDHDSGSEQPSA